MTMSAARAPDQSSMKCAAPFSHEICVVNGDGCWLTTILYRIVPAHANDAHSNYCFPLFSAPLCLHIEAA